MLPVIYEWLQIFCATVLCSMTVKLLDDYLDREIDAACGEHNWINRLGEGSVAYSLPFLAISVALRPEIGITLFLASWSIGMYRNLTIKYPSALRGWQESALALAIGCCFAGWKIMLSSFLLTAAVQISDDIIDRYTDQTIGIRNLAQQWGIIPCSAVGAAFFLGAGLIAPTLFWPVFCGIAVVYTASLCQRRSTHD